MVEAKTPLVIFGATAAGLPAPPWVYSMTILPGPKDTATAVKVVDAMKPKTAAYILAADNDAFKGRMNATRTALEAKGVTTAGVVNVLTKDTDFTAAATQAMGLKPDIILVYATQGAAAGAITALHDRGYAKTIVGNDVLSPAPIFKKMGDSVVGVPFPVGFSDTHRRLARGQGVRRRLPREVQCPARHLFGAGLPGGLVHRPGPEVDLGHADARVAGDGALEGDQDRPSGLRRRDHEGRPGRDDGHARRGLDGRRQDRALDAAEVTAGAMELFLEQLINGSRSARCTRCSVSASGSSSRPWAS